MNIAILVPEPIATEPSRHRPATTNTGKTNDEHNNNQGWNANSFQKTGARDNLFSAKIVKNAALKIYKDAPHGMCTTRKEEINADLLAFIKS